MKGYVRILILILLCIFPLNVKAQYSLSEAELKALKKYLQKKAEVKPLKKKPERIVVKVKPKKRIPPAKKIVPFGYNFFARTKLETIQNIPVTSDYIIGPGDVIQVNIWGRINQQYKLEVSREGKVFIPNVGEFTVAGLTFQQMKNLIENQVSRITGAKVDVTLDRLRSIVVFVTGEVKKPGAYVLTPMHTVIDALIAAGGPTEVGSLRNIVLRRDFKIVQKIDLYDLLLKGIKPKRIRLLHGDVIFVPIVGPRVKVTGQVKRPAIYELKKEKTLIEVLNLAGGLLPEAWKGRIQVERIENHTQRIVLDVKATRAKVLKTFKVKDGDWIKVFSVLPEKEKVVYLKGNVKRPGEYAYRRGMRVIDVLKGPEDLLPDTFMDYALVKRYHPETNTYEYKFFSLKGLFIAKNPADNLLLQPKDTIVIFNKWDVIPKKKVHIYGAVNKPGDYEWFPGMKLSDLLKLAGGLKRYAYYKGELVRKIPDPKGTRTEIIKVDIIKALSGKKAYDLPLIEDDSVIVRPVPEWYENITVKIEGEVRFPGTYVIRKGEKLSSLIKRAGGFTEKAYLRGARFIRKSIQKRQQKFLDELISRLEQELLVSETQTVGAALTAEEAKVSKMEHETIRRFISRLRTLKATGRMVIRLAPPEKLAGTPYDISLEDGDEIYIPRKPATILVQGAVFNPGAYIYTPKKDLDDYIKMAGGYLKIADKENVYILKVDGSATRPKEKRISFRWNSEKHCWEKVSMLKLEPGDTIVVPYKLKIMPWMKNIKDITQILYQISVTTGIVVATF